jgi:hypothetical protein
VVVVVFVDLRMIAHGWAHCYFHTLANASCIRVRWPQPLRDESEKISEI